MSSQLMLTKFRLLKNNINLRRYAANTSWLFLERFLKMPISLIIVVLLTRYLGPENYGLLSYAQSYVGIFIAFSTLGIDVILVRELSKDKEKNDKLLGTAITLKLIASTIAIAIIFIINFKMGDKEAALLVNIIAFMLIFQSINTFDAYFQANVLSKFSVIANTVAFIFSSGLKLGLIFFEKELTYFAYALVLDSILIALGYLYIYIKQQKLLSKLKYDKVIAIYFIKNGWPLMIVALAAFIYTRTDQLMLKHLVGNEAVGNYAAAIRVSELFYFIPLLITQSIFPKIVELKRKSEEQYFEFLEKLYKLLVWSAIPITLGLFFCNDMIIFALYGEQYVESSEVLSILAFTIVFNALGIITTRVLYIERYEKKYLYRSILGVLVNIVLNFWLIELYGTKGAAISTLITLFIIYYVYDVFDKELHKFYYLKVKCFIPVTKIK